MFPFVFLETFEEGIKVSLIHIILKLRINMKNEIKQLLIKFDRLYYQHRQNIEELFTLPLKYPNELKLTVTMKRKRDSTS